MRGLFIYLKEDIVDFSDRASLLERSIIGSCQCAGHRCTFPLSEIYSIEFCKQFPIDIIWFKAQLDGNYALPF
jgi:hypothetical protein